MAGRERTTKISYVAAGINIIHINTELRVAWRDSLDESLAHETQVVPYEVLSPVVDAVKKVVRSRLELFNSPRGTRPYAGDQATP